jgi:hypothetical protein
MYEKMVENAQQMKKLMEEIESLVKEMEAFVARSRKKGVPIKLK